MKIDVNNPCCICNSTESRLCFEAKYREHKYPGIFSIRKCLQCGLIFNSPRLDEEGLRDLYRGGYYFFHRKNAVEFERIVEMYQRTVAILGSKLKEKRVVEIGSAKGYLLAVLKKLGWDANGIEISPEASDFARTIFGVKNFTGTLEEYAKQPEANTYPVVMAIDLIEHVSDPVAFIRAVGRIVEKNGLLLIDTPNGAAENISVEGVQWQGFNPFHIFLFFVENLSRLLEDNGFIIEQAFSYGNTKKCLSAKQQAMRQAKEKVMEVLSTVGLLNVLRRLRNSDHSGKSLEDYLEEAVNQIQTKESYFKSQDYQAELSRGNKGDNIVVIARRI